MVKELIRFIYVIAGNLHRAWMIPLMGYYSRHPEKYSERFRYEYNKHAIRLMNHTGRIYTQAYGAENLPKDGGYVMFANHQGKYDALGIMLTHEEYRDMKSVEVAKLVYDRITAAIAYAEKYHPEIAVIQ